MTSDPLNSNTGAAAEERYCPSCERSFGSDVERCPDDGTSLVRFDKGKDTFVGRDIDGRFTIKERLGSGGMGAVYRAIQHSVGREVAIKIINASQVSEPTAAKRFLREAKLTSRLVHPNTVAMLDFGQTKDGLFYLVMELLRGRTLRRVLEVDGRFDATRLVRIGGQICDALSVAHGMSIIHRDLKPSNVMVLDEPAGRDLVKVLDFGLAKSLAGDTNTTTVTGSGKALGTPAYMSPEVCRGRDSDARGDLYSLGVILYELVRGQQPFTGETPHELLMKHITELPPPLEKVPRPIAVVIERLLAKRPEDRYASASATHEALDLALSRLAPHRPRGKIGKDGLPLADTVPAKALPDLPSTAIGPSTARALAAVRRRWLLPLAGLVALLAIVVFTARWLWPPTSTQSPSPSPSQPPPTPTPTPTPTPGPETRIPPPETRIPAPADPPPPSQATALAHQLDLGAIRGLASTPAGTHRSHSRDRARDHNGTPAPPPDVKPPDVPIDVKPDVKPAPKPEDPPPKKVYPF